MKPVPTATSTIPTHDSGPVGPARHRCPAMMTRLPYSTEDQGPMIRSAKIPPGIANRYTAAP